MANKANKSSVQYTTEFCGDNILRSGSYKDNGVDSILDVNFVRYLSS